jgi:hypothetical protein
VGTDHVPVSRTTYSLFVPPVVFGSLSQPWCSARRAAPEGLEVLWDVLTQGLRPGLRFFVPRGGTEAERFQHQRPIEIVGELR